ncbi:MAG: hypothetical protein CMM60_08700 [Rhodospirillaceae bacterium]|jgi:methionyl-tRNA formyltransferase|nr:hypothetical protein [Rhodospirillaceae bacterium]|tara:strand:- start:8273 stop:8860 length:588 start_codon:yes stop_codon:yes gene_type:complete
MTSVTYPYASGDLLEDRHTYFYSEYAGRPFLDAWRAQRSELLEKLPEAADPPAGKEDAASLEGEVIETDALLDHLFAVVAHGGAGEDRCRDGLAQLVKKFEVTKRIHQSYGPSFRAIDPADHKDLNRYLRLAEVFEFAYAAEKELPYLNLLLKCMDTLSSLADQLTEDGRARLAGLIQRERRHIDGQEKSLGLTP